jgi:hypothetical protein
LSEFSRAGKDAPDVYARATKKFRHVQRKTELTC